MILNASREVAVPPETHYFDLFWKKTIPPRSFLARSTFEHLARAYLDTWHFDSLGLSGSEKDLLAAEAGRSGSHGLFLDRILSLYAQQEGKLYWTEKTPGHICYLDPIMAIFPNAKVIIVVRDPRDVFLSHKGVPWGVRNPVVLARQWRMTTRKALSASRSEWLLVRYEDLVARPEETIRLVTSFVGIPFEDQLLRFYETAGPNYDSAREPWKTRASSPIDSSNIGKWRRGLRPVEGATIEAIASAEMSSLGYRGIGPGATHGLSPLQALWALQATFAPAYSIVRRSKRSSRDIGTGLVRWGR